MMCGFSAILAYSTIIFKQMEDKGDLFLTPIQSTAAISTVGMLSTALAYFPIKYFNFRTTMLIGFMVMFVAMTLIGVFSQMEQSRAFLVCMMVFYIGFQTSLGAISYFYPSEVLVDSATGVVIFTSNFCVLIVSLST